MLSRRTVVADGMAEEIITAFEESLAVKAERTERLGIIQHWLDFYQAHKYRRMMRRRRATDQERMTPCSACGYPASHRHHLWDIATHGETDDRASSRFTA
jgi:ribosomal protein L37E